MKGTFEQLLKGIENSHPVGEYAPQRIASRLSDMLIQCRSQGPLVRNLEMQVEDVVYSIPLWFVLILEYQYDRGHHDRMRLFESALKAHRFGACSG